MFTVPCKFRAVDLKLVGEEKLKNMRLILL
jgi:hypothetical protein